MFECSCVYSADPRPKWERRVQAGRSRYAASYDTRVQAIHDGAPCPQELRTTHYEFAAACLARAIYDDSPAV